MLAEKVCFEISISPRFILKCALYRMFSIFLTHTAVFFKKNWIWNIYFKITRFQNSQGVEKVTEIQVSKQNEAIKKVVTSILYF